MNNNQSSPLGMASTKGHAAVIKLLLAAGADVAHKDKWNNTTFVGSIAGP